MESVSRPPHRRKHSSTNANAFVSFSSKNPYDDVLLSGGGKKTKSFGAHEYAEIFAGSSSSIPVLDLSGLDERVGSGESRIPKLDYCSIFGGLRDDDVAVPYEELLNGAKKAKCSSDKPGILGSIPADSEVHWPESGPLHSPGKTQRSSGQSVDQSVDGVKQQFNLSFNITSQRNDDASNRKTHIAQLHDVPGFTYFIDGVHQLRKTEDGKPAPLPKREVSRTWSFNTDLEAVKSKGGPSSGKVHTPDKSHNVTESNFKSHLLNVPPHPSNIKDLNDSKGSRLSSFPVKENALKIDGDSSPPLFEEELDENSVAAISAAALKKAVEQAQESIRIAKMIMEKKREGLQDGSKPRPKGRLKVKDKKENRIDLKVRDNFEEAKEHGEAFNGVGMKLGTSCSQSDTLHNIEKAELEKLGKTVEAAEAHEGASYFPELVAKAQCRTAILECGLVDNKNSVFSMNKPASNLEMMETGKETLEQIEVSVHHSKGGPEDFAELEDRAFNTSGRTQELKKTVDETMERSKIAVDHINGPRRVTELVERALNNSQSTPVPEKTLDGVGANLRISEEEKVNERCHDVIDDEGKCENKSEECGEVVNVEHLKLSNLMNESRNLDGKDESEQEETQKKSVDVPKWRENDYRHGESMNEEENGIRQKEAHIWLESNEQMKEVINESEPEVFPEIKEVEKTINGVHEPAIDDNCVHDGDGKIVQGEFEQNSIEGSYMDAIEDEAVETKLMEGNSCMEFEKNEVSSVAEETEDPLRGEGRSEENEKKSEFQEAAYEIHAEAVNDAKNNETNTIFNETRCSNASASFSETQESCEVDFNDRIEENGSIPGLTETFSAIDMGKAEPPFLSEDNDTCTTDILHRSASEDNFAGSSLHYVFDGLPFDYRTENVGIANVNNEEKSPKDEDIFKNSTEIHDTAQETADKFNFQNSPEVHVHPSDYRVAEYDLTDEKLESDRTSAMDGGSESTSSVENLDGLLIHESKQCDENAKNETSKMEEVEDNIEMTSKEMNHLQEGTEDVSFQEQSDGVYSQLHSEPKEMEEAMESEESVERGEILKKNNANVNGISTSDEKNSKENVQNFDKEDQQQRIEAIKRGREREKDRIAVERAIREARERAFAEARERATAERAAAEVRQRVMAEAREKLEKASTTSKQPAVKASTEAKLRSERAAVERATAEARERALEKAMSQKTSTEGRACADRYPTEKFSGASRNNALKHSFSSSDLENFDGTSNESAQRRKARLERHQRIMERAAKALEEKNMRDHLAQKEQAERNRLAESLDADIKRWVTGKEGNLRALLSTLQYILGPNSGWQPISLTEIITTVAVKKAYRKATLYVHPDKLQQRGASIQQKYICEKVFFLLKAAWNRFDSEER